MAEKISKQQESSQDQLTCSCGNPAVVIAEGKPVCWDCWRGVSQFVRDDKMGRIKNLKSYRVRRKKE